VEAEEITQEKIPYALMPIPEHVRIPAIDGRDPSEISFDEIQELVKTLDIIQLAEHPYLAGLVLNPGQRVALKAIYGLEIEKGTHEWELYRYFTGESDWQDPDSARIYDRQFPRDKEYCGTQHGLGKEAREIVLCLGRRSGKSLAIIAICKVFEAICRAHKHRESLQEKEIGLFLCIATRLDQAKDIMGLAVARIFEGSPLLVHYLDGLPKVQSVLLNNSMKIQSNPCSSVAGRGPAVPFFSLDEAAHFTGGEKGSKNATEVWKALKPGQITFRHAKRATLSSPLAENGLFYEQVSAGCDVPNRVTLIACTRAMNPALVPSEEIELEFKDDPINAMREYGAHFVKQTSAFFPYQINNCYSMECLDHPYDPRYIYHAAIDQSGLSGGDNFAFCVAHSDENGNIKTDCLRLLDSKDIDEILEEISGLCGQYYTENLEHDRYASGYVAHEIEKYGLIPNVRPLLPKIYQNAKTLIIADKLKMQDNIALRSGMANTLATYGNNSSLSICHVRDQYGHSDLADAVCSAVWLASSQEEEITEGEFIHRFDTSELLEDDFLVIH